MIGHKTVIKKVVFTSASQELTVWPNAWVSNASSPRSTERGANAPFSVYVIPLDLSVETVTDVVFRFNNDDEGTKFNIFDSFFRDRATRIPYTVHQPIAVSVPDFSPDMANPTCILTVELRYQDEADTGSILERVRRWLCAMGIS